MKKAMIFDMDGTLWDSVDSIVVSWNAALQQMGETDVTVTRPQIMSLMGNTMDVFARTLFPHYTPEKGAQWIDILGQIENEFLSRYGAVLLGDVKGVFARLREMGYGVYIVSNCQDGYIQTFLQVSGLGDCFVDFTCSGMTGLGKGSNIRLLMEKHQITRAVYVGDTQGDYNACQKAQVPFIHASYGMGTVEQPVPCINCFAELPAALERLVK